MLQVACAMWRAQGAASHWIPSISACSLTSHHPLHPLSPLLFPRLRRRLHLTLALILLLASTATPLPLPRTSSTAATLAEVARIEAHLVALGISLTESAHAAAGSVATLWTSTRRTVLMPVVARGAVHSVAAANSNLWALATEFAGHASIAGQAGTSLGFVMRSEKMERGGRGGWDRRWSWMRVSPLLAVSGRTRTGLDRMRYMKRAS